MVEEVLTCRAAAGDMQHSAAGGRRPAAQASFHLSC